MLSILPFILGLNVAHADAKFVKQADVLTAQWPRSTTDTQLNRVGRQTYTLLKHQATRPCDAADIAALVRLLGVVYIRDLDPRADTLALFKAKLAEPDFRKAFDEQVNQLSNEQKTKLRESIDYLPQRDKDED